MKVYVEIKAEFSINGGIKPKQVCWGDGSKFEIDRVKAVERAPCKSGGVLPIRYTVMISGQEKYLYYERDKERWFVEKLIQ